MTDIEGSTRLLAELGDDYGPVLEAHRDIVRDQLARHDGIEVETEGDAFFCVFPRAADAVRAMVEVQRCLAARPWPGRHAVRIRVGLHTGDGVLSGGGYVGMDVHEVAGVTAAGHGGQILLTAAPTPISGPADDAARVRELLNGHRLVTLTGPGGVRKTRLALHVAGLSDGHFPDGVVFVPLAEVRDAELVPDEIARALALPAASYSGGGIERL